MLSNKKEVINITYFEGWNQSVLNAIE